MNYFPVRIPNLDLAQIQLLHVFFDLRAVAHRKHDHLVRQNVFLRHGLRLLGRHGINAVRQCRIVVERQIEREKFREARRRFRAAFEPPGKRPRNGIL